MTIPIETLNIEIKNHNKKYLGDKFFGVELSPEDWLIEEVDFGLDEQHIQESLFTLGNGFIGSRGVLEELPERAMPGTFIAGVYDKSGAQVEEIVNLPTPIHFIIAAEGEKLDMRFMKFLHHRRYLDMQKGILVRKTLFEDGKKRRFLYRSLRFFSMNNPHIAYMKISLTLLNGSAELTALDILDDSVTNTGGLIYGSRRHIRLMEADIQKHINYYAYKTHTSKIWIAYADRLSVNKKGAFKVLNDRVYNFKMKAGETVTFTKALAITTSLQYHATEIKRQTLRLLKDAVSLGFDKNLKNHIDQWMMRWDHANVTIKGDELCDKALRFNVYHLIIAVYKGSFPMSVGARALTGQGYRGHIFWDSEIFMLPFYIYTDPEIAKNMILYRYRRLNEAKKNAKKRGYEGALFPWESGYRGDDVTPPYSKDTDGQVIEMDTMDFEQHISADTSYGVYNYYRATDDMDFMAMYGAEMIFEIARFWESRVSYNKTRKKYEIRAVTGPDEFHNHVDNNAYTNIMAAWNLEYACTLYRELKKNRPRSFGRLHNILRINGKEAEKWNNIGRLIYVPRSKKGRLIEQFEGYFKKKDGEIKDYNNFFIPEAPSHISYDDFGKLKFIKQADALLLFYLLPGRFTHDERIRNYKYYIEKTLHQSSLSPSTHALLAAEFNDPFRAYALFLFSLQLDLKNLHHNSDGGIHTANNGGIWQAAVFGFAGLKLEDETVRIDPCLPQHWSYVQFNIFWKHHFLKFKISNKSVTVTNYPVSPEHKSISVDFQGRNYKVEPFKTVVAVQKNKEAHMKCIKDIMNKEKFATVNKNLPANRISHLLIEKDISGVPVVDDKDELIGFVSKENILKVTEDENFPQLRAEDIMIQDVAYVKEDDHIEIAIRVFTEFPYHVLPVLRDKIVVGLITRNEILSTFIGENS